jgi:hypothetical protein
MQILVKSVITGSAPETVNCFSDHAFLVHGVTNGRGEYSINVRSTRTRIGVSTATFTVGGIAKDEVTLVIQPGTTGIITLQTDDAAKAHFS